MEYRINRVALRRALDELGVKARTDVRLVGWVTDEHGPTRDRGACSTDQDTREHYVQIAMTPGCSCPQHQGAAGMIETLLHELRHCQQHERPGFGVEMAFSRMFYDYTNDPSEVDARTWAAEAAGRYTDLIEEVR